MTHTWAHIQIIPHGVPTNPPGGKDMVLHAQIPNRSGLITALHDRIRFARVPGRTGDRFDDSALRSYQSWGGSIDQQKTLSSGHRLDGLTHFQQRGEHLEHLIVDLDQPTPAPGMSPEGNA